MSFDVKMFVLCTHVINGEVYEPQTCKRCYGKGFYFDIHFDELGTVTTATSTSKLQQELIKIMMEDKGSNIFHENWGNEINDRMIGTKGSPFATIKIEMLVRDALNYLMDVQKENQILFQNMDESEIMDSIVSVDVQQIDVTGFEVSVVIQTLTGDIVSMSVQI